MMMMMMLIVIIISTKCILEIIVKEKKGHCVLDEYK